jgi:hypothetical protein
VVLGCGEKIRGVGRGAVRNGVLEGSFYTARGGVPRRTRRGNDRRSGGFNGRVNQAHHGRLRCNLKGGGVNGQGVKEERAGLALGGRAAMAVEA